MVVIKIENDKITVKKSFKQARDEYLKLIEEAKSLGELDEVTRLQKEWATKKQEFESQ
ncbi:MAG: hypothetical protein N4A64_04615 [Marinisporobacter sp.]|jgi:hypothetical protein|nr:hypothetical protein [Marinisporobacter sp.]